LNDKDNIKHYEEKHKNDLLRDFYEEEYMRYISDEENPSINCDAFQENEINFDIHAEKSLPSLIRKNIDLLKYYKKRYILFSRYDKGIQLDKGMYFIYFLIIDENFPYTYARLIITNFLQRAGIPLHQNQLQKKLLKFVDVIQSSMDFVVQVGTASNLHLHVKKVNMTCARASVCVCVFLKLTQAQLEKYRQNIKCVHLINETRGLIYFIVL